MRAQGPSILEPKHDNISWAPLSRSVYVDFLLLDYVQKVIVFMSNALVVKSNPHTYFHTIEPDFCV